MYSFTHGEGFEGIHLLILVYTAPPSAPPWLLATNLNSTSFTLSWTRPSNTYNQPYNFTISCNDTSYGNDGQQRIETSLDIVSYTALSLQPGATYQCCVSAVNNAGENTTCNHTNTLEIGEYIFDVINFFIKFFTAPTGSPENVSQRALNSTVIMLSWTELPYRQRNGIVSHYAVRVCQIEPYGQCEEYLATGTTLELLLHPHYKYSWTVAAYTVAMGPYNESLPFQMPEDSKCMMLLLGGMCLLYIQNNFIISCSYCMHVPRSIIMYYDIYSVCSAGMLYNSCHIRTGPSDSPQNVSHGSLSDSSVQLFWSPPPLDNQNGIIIRYNVYIVNANNTVISRTLEVSVMLTTKVESLEEFTTFWFWLSAVTAVGEGPYTVYGPVTTAIGE